MRLRLDAPVSCGTSFKAPMRHMPDLKCQFVQLPQLNLKTHSIDSIQCNLYRFVVSTLECLVPR